MPEQVSRVAGSEIRKETGPELAEPVATVAFTPGELSHRAVPRRAPDLLF